MSILEAAAASHVEAFRSTGTSPGLRSPDPTSGSLSACLDLDHHGPTRLRIGYAVQGPSHAPAVVVLGGISAHRHAAPSATPPSPGWWPGVVGEGAPLDTRRHRVVGIDWIGGPDGGWRPSHPVTPSDQAQAVLAVLDHLRLSRVSVVGASYGGMVALALAAERAERVQRAAVLCAAHRPHPHATAIRAVQRGILRLGGGRADAVALARALAMTTYRTAQEFDQRFDSRADAAAAPRFPVEAYLESRGAAFARRFDAASYTALSASIDLHDVDPGRVTVPLLLVSVSSDAVSPPWLADELAARAGGPVRHLRLDSPWGHDAFLKEAGTVGGLLAEFLTVGTTAEVAR